MLNTLESWDRIVPPSQGLCWRLMDSQPWLWKIELADNFFKCVVLLLKSYFFPNIHIFSYFWPKKLVHLLKKFLTTVSNINAARQCYNIALASPNTNINEEVRWVPKGKTKGVSVHPHICNSDNEKIQLKQIIRRNGIRKQRWKKVVCSSFPHKRELVSKTN